MLLAPLGAFVVAISSVRTRRAAANTTLFGVLVSLAAALLVGWGLARTAKPYVASYVYLSTNVAFTGPVNFENFEVDIVLRASHLIVLAIALIDVCIGLVLLWNRVMGRNEPGPARFNAVISIFLFAAIGTLMSYDLAELFTFWAIAGGATYLLLAHRWGADEPARTGRIALALPFLTDLFLLCGIAVLYSRYGKQNLADLLPILHTTAGWTVRQLIVASVLLFVGVSGRMALWPLHSWITRTATTSPPAASAIAQAVWPVIAVTVLYRLLPIFVATNRQTMKDFVIACAVSAVIAPLASMLGREPRQAFALAGSGLAALGAAIAIHGEQFPAFTFAVAGVLVVYAAAPARAAATLAGSSIVAAMRTLDMSEMGDAWRRLRASAGALLGAGLVLGIAAVGALAIAVDTRSRFGATMGEALFLVSVAGLRVFLSVATGPLLRRRAFDPDRVRDAPQQALAWPYWMVVLSIALAGLTLLTAWLGFLDADKHKAAAPAAYAIWLVVAVLGFAAAGFAYASSKQGALRAATWIDTVIVTRSATVLAFLDRYLVVPSYKIVDRVTAWIPAGDGALGRVSVLSGRMSVTAVAAPALPVLVVMGVLVALLIALVSPGVLR
jgi:NADH:ubiquinone oxidoreductase subunit 5 (subunit L)/multisubunit Na+/H+ antiporter MnhA subunit